MMNGFNVPAQKGFVPFQMLSPEVLAQLAAASFKPPQPMAVPGMQMIGMGMGQQQPADMGAGLGAGMAGLGSIASMLGPMMRGGGVEAARTAGDADLGGYSKTGPGGMVDVGNGVMLPNPNQPDSYGPAGSGAGGLAGVMGRLGLKWPPGGLF